MCANRVVAGVRHSALRPIMRQRDTRQVTGAQLIDQLEGLALAIPWGSSPPSAPRHKEGRFSGLFLLALTKSYRLTTVRTAREIDRGGLITLFGFGGSMAAELE
jgi:hypothetical protein